MDRKLILPAEVKVCATCSFWDGERKIDAELQVVVVDESVAGECLVREIDCPSMQDVRGINGECAWESLGPDVLDASIDPVAEAAAADLAADTTSAGAASQA
ncbi:hypothetical protein [Rhodocyclus tenuis]|uniref:Uncharacterized protein n=1 Tax=Rhodocyclus tenuis TaxID=1066 RepID=A0A840FZI5_RHOTE|nr:hypothetical protein [Rhodocyclus tenuis]MBB4247304.1 hypothetical protein [Rhodocyclus tenuis]MBK1681307.1 hypothetical protein [Rhodocyclus tenuis]